MKKVIICTFLSLFLVGCSSSEIDDSNINEWIRRNLNDSITELVFPDINICRQAIYKKTSESEKENQKNICNKMQENLISTSSDWVNKIKKYYNASILDDKKRNCIFDLWFKLNDEWKFASDQEIEQCIK